MSCSSLAVPGRRGYPAARLETKRQLRFVSGPFWNSFTSLWESHDSGVPAMHGASGLGDRPWWSPTETACATLPRRLSLDERLAIGLGHFGHMSSHHVADVLSVTRRR